MKNINVVKTVNIIKKMKKNSEPIVMITAYDYIFANIFNDYVDMILVGDSLNMSFLGKKDTISATMNQMIYHTQAVCNGATLPLIVFDMPFGSYSSKEMALKNAVRVYQETNAQTVKIEGGEDKAEIVKYLVDNYIAVIGHIGLNPQSFRTEGNYKIEGKTEESLNQLKKDAKALEEAGAFALVIEAVPKEVGKIITDLVSIPVIGIGAGVDTDGQVLVCSDIFSLTKGFKPKFVKEYVDCHTIFKDGVQNYVDEVKNKTFPTDKFSY